MKRFSILLATGLLFVLFSGCGSDSTAGETVASTTVPVKDVASSFGAEFTADEVVPADQLLTTYERTELVDTLQTTLKGTVNSVCQAKGCWMTIAAGEGEEMMVKFKDYGFFMPKDISGREVVMHGMAYYQITPVDELRHFAEDAGKSPEEIAEITEPKTELHFLADGVQLVPGEM
jgi:hypothetical protein